ncbi:hypothetical protein HN836_04845, partial [Candidatus Woesearchaeota archaeon]|nr:hypothetical protein [Candidatus Woesearchaeota archaeon]
YINNFDFSLDGDVNNIFVLNNKKNLNFLINHWDELSKHKNLSFYFINPDSSIDKLWIISPYIHSKICEPDNIERSLNSLFSSVCEIK